MPPLKTNIVLLSAGLFVVIVLLLHEAELSSEDVKYLLVACLSYIGGVITSLTENGPHESNGLPKDEPKSDKRGRFNL